MLFQTTPSSLSWAINNTGLWASEAVSDDTAEVKEGCQAATDREGGEYEIQP